MSTHLTCFKKKNEQYTTSSFYFGFKLFLRVFCHLTKMVGAPSLPFANNLRSSYVWWVYSYHPDELKFIQYDLITVSRIYSSRKSDNKPLTQFIFSSICVPFTLRKSKLGIWFIYKYLIFSNGKKWFSLYSWYYIGNLFTFTSCTAFWLEPYLTRHILILYRVFVFIFGTFYLKCLFQWNTKIIFCKVQRRFRQTITI